MKRLAAIALLLALGAAPARAQTALWFAVPGDGRVVTVEGHISGVATWYGVFALEDENANGTPECNTTGFGAFACRITSGGLAQISIPYVPTDARCGVRPTVRYTIDGVAGAAYGPAPDLACAYLPGVAR